MNFLYENAPILSQCQNKLIINQFMKISVNDIREPYIISIFDFFFQLPLFLEELYEKSVIMEN